MLQLYVIIKCLQALLDNLNKQRQYEISLVQQKCLLKSQMEGDLARMYSCHLKGLSCVFYMKGPVADRQKYVTKLLYKQGQETQTESVWNS